MKQIIQSLLKTGITELTELPAPAQPSWTNINSNNKGV